MPTLSNLLVQPFLVVTYGALGANISVDNMYIMSIIALAVVVMLFGTLGMSRSKKKTVPVYMAGITANSDERLFRGSLGGKVKATSRNWYMNELFGEKVLDKPATIVTAVIMVVGLVASLAGSQMGAENFVGTSLAMYMPLATMNEDLLQTLLGIVLFADTLNAWMEPVLPRFVAEALSMTIAAQVFTLPIQVLIEPELPVFSIPANLMVAPFVGFATLAGLASLAVSWLIPWLGLQLARAASWGTAVMELTALELGSGSQATIPWAGGVGGAVLVCVVEAACAAAAIMTHRLFGRMMVQEPDLPGKRLIANPVERLRMWMERTRKALRELQWEE